MQVPILHSKTKVTRMLSALTISLFLFLTSLTAQDSGNWTAFHGSDRTNKSAETGLLKKWPAAGPVLLMTIQGIGEGYSTVTLAEGLIFTAGTINQQPYVFAFDLSGRLIWKQPNGTPWSTNASYARSYTGARSTPTYSDGMVYQLGEMGRLAAFNAKTGTEIWARDLAKEFEAAPTEYGYAESVLIDGAFLYTRPAGKKGFVVCLEKKTGKTVWTNNEVPGIEGYSSFIIHETGGFRQIIGSSSNSYFGIDIKTGKLLWKTDFRNSRDLNNTDATAFNDLIFISSGYGKGSMLIRLRKSGSSLTPETVWQSGLMDNHHGGVILHEGYLYGAGSESRGWFCLDLMTGKQAWNFTNGKGSITYADGMLYLYDERGIVKLIRATPESFESHGEFRLPSKAAGPYWAHPVVSGGCLYLRHGENIFIYDVQSK